MYEQSKGANTPGERYAICVQCPFFVKQTTQCRKCWCIMKLKVKVRSAQCPVGKWGKIT